MHQATNVFAGSPQGAHCNPIVLYAVFTQLGFALATSIGIPRVFLSTCHLIDRVARQARSRLGET